MTRGAGHGRAEEERDRRQTHATVTKAQSRNVFSKDAAVATTMAFLPSVNVEQRVNIKANISPFFRSELMRPYSFRKVGRAAIFIQTANLSLSTPTNGEMMSGNVRRGTGTCRGRGRRRPHGRPLDKLPRKAHPSSASRRRARPYRTRSTARGPPSSRTPCSCPTTPCPRSPASRPCASVSISCRWLRRRPSRACRSRRRTHPLPGRTA